MFKKYNIVIKLVAINVAVFLVLNIIKVAFYLFNVDEGTFSQIMNFISVPSNTKELLTRIWTPITYMFVQEKFWHLLGNMLWLYFLGIILNQYLLQKDFLALYIVGGLAGAVMYILAFNIFPVFATDKIFSILLGASASVTAIVVALATLKPKEEVYFFGIIRVKLVYIAILMIVYDFFLLKSDNSGGHFAHLGGALYGFIFASQFKKGKNITAGFADFIARLLKMEPRPKRKTKAKVVKNNLKTNNDYKYNKTVHDINSEIDRILEKISQKGYKSLSKKEKDFLKKNGHNYK